MAAPDAPMAFRERAGYLTVPDLEQLVRVCPSAETFRAGFSFQDTEVDELLRVAKQIEGAQVYVDPGYPQAWDLSGRVVRVMQLALDVQFRENDQLVNDFNAMREEMQELEERERLAQGELDRLRALRDKEQGTGDAGQLREKNEDLARRLDDEYRSNDRMRQQRERDERRIEDLEYRLKRADDDLRNRDDSTKDMEAQLRRVQEDYTDLRATYESLRAEHAAQEAKQQIGDTLRQQEWKVERLVKENRALELQNVELRKQVQDVKGENLEVSEKIVLLDEEVRKLKAHEADLESYQEQLAADKTALMSTQEELRGEIAEKMGLLESFEARFQRQFRSWEEERATLQAQIEALRRGDAGGARAARGGGAGGWQGGAADTADVQDLRDQLNHALEKEVLLLEAYEQLELSVAGEIDQALAKQAEDLKASSRRVDFLTKRIDEERANAAALRQHQAALEDQIKDAQLRNQQYERGVYGLPQAVEEIHQLKDAVFKEQGRVRELVGQINNLSRKVEDLADENSVLRRKAGLADTDKVDTSDIRMQKDATIAQLRSLNALLERQVADLEEERRKLRMEMKFRAKYHGQHALEMGLSPEQLLLVEQIVDEIKGGRNQEAKLVDQLTHRIQFLEVRLGEVMAYADIPPSMRPALSEFDPVAAVTGKGALVLGPAAAGTNRVAGSPYGFKAAQVEAVKAALLKSLGMLRQMKTSLAEKRHVSDADYLAWTEQLITQLTDSEQAVDAILKEASRAAAQAGAAGATAAGGAAGAGAGAGAVTPGRTQPGGAGQGYAGGELPPDFLADAMADELRERLKQLAKQAAELQASVITKDAVIQQLMNQKADLEKKYGQPITERKTDTVSCQDYDHVVAESNSLKEQLVSCLEELAAREREAADLATNNSRYQVRMQTYADQVKMLYREYAVSLSTWKSEKMVLERKNKKLQEEADGNKAAAAEYSRALDTMSKGNLSDMQKDLMDTVRRMAVVQIKHAKIARQLEAANVSERALQERVEELEQEVRDVSSTCRSRMRWLETAADNAKRRVNTLFRDLQASVPLSAYQMLAEKHSRQQGELRRLVEEAAQQVVSAEELFRLRDEVAAWMSKHDATCNTNSELKERVRQFELQHQTASKDLEVAQLDLKMTQELIACRVAADTATRRLQLAESERTRCQRTLEETQTRLTEVEDRLGQAAAEVELLRSSRAAVEQRYVGALTKQESEDLLRRLNVAEALAAEKHNDYANLCHRAQEAEQKLEQATRDRKRYLAEITNLRAALRDVSGHRETASVVGKLHEQLDHALAKESLARNALNRSELLRFEAEKELRKVQNELTNCGGRTTSLQDQARWADKQRVEAQAQLDITLAGRTEAWKAKLWARKLQQLKVRNDAIAEALDKSRRRIKTMEDGQEANQLKAETLEDVSALLAKGVSEVVRDAARLHEQGLQLRLERGKLQREEVLLREKVHYVERVNAELHELIEKYESEFFQQQLLLEGDKATALTQARGLQDEVVRLQERLGQLQVMRDTEHMDQARKSLMAGPGELRVSGDIGVRLKAHLSAANADDRAIMLKQIDSLRIARQDGEHLRQEVHRLTDELAAQGAELSDVRRHHNDALARLKQQSEALLYALNHQHGKGAADETAVEQMRAVAEATITELKERLKERQKQVDALQELLGAEKERWLAQHQADRAEIERLNQCLFKTNNESIRQMKDMLGRQPPRSGGDDVGFHNTHMRDTMSRADADVTALTARIEEMDAARELMERAHHSKIRDLCEEIEGLNRQLEAARQHKGPTKEQLDKLKRALDTKDDKLRQLRDAFKTLEDKWVAAAKDMTDKQVKHADDLASARKQVKESEVKREALDRENQQLKAELSRLRRELEALKQSGLVGDADSQSCLQHKIQELSDQGRQLDQAKAQLHQCQLELRRFKNAERTVMDLTTGMSVEAKRQIDELQRRLNVVDTQNRQLKRTLQANDSTFVPQDADECGTSADAGPSSGRGAARGVHSEGGARAAGRPVEEETDAAAAARTAAAVAQWDENKKLNKKIEDLRKKVASKQEEVVAARAEADKAAHQVAQLQKEVDRQSAAIKTMQEKLTAAAHVQPVKPTPDLPKLQVYVDKLAAAEAECDKLRLQLAKASSSGGEGGGAGPSSSRAAPGGGAAVDTVARDADLFEARLQRDQAQAQAARLKQRLTELFGEQAADLTAPRGVGKPGVRRSSAGQVPQVGGSSSSRPGLSTAREAELMTTITNLKMALEKATATTTPTTKYMAEVQRRKDAQKECADLRGEVDKLRLAGVTRERLAADLQAKIDELKRQLKSTQEAGATEMSMSAAAAAQVGSLEQAMKQRDAEILALKAIIKQKDQQLAGSREAGSGSSSREAAELQQLRARLSDLQTENADLKAELNAFDPLFFEEIEDLKHEHHVLGGQVREYESMIVELCGQLGRPVPFRTR